MKPIPGTITDPAMDPLVTGLTMKDVREAELERTVERLVGRIQKLHDMAEGRLRLVQVQKRDIDRLGAELRQERIARQAAEEQLAQMERGLE